MSLQRRQLLQILSYAFGSLSRNEFAMVAQNPAQPASPAPPAKAALHINREERKWKK